MLRKLAARLQDRFRDRRAELFVEFMRPKPGASLLDLGGEDGAFAQRITKLIPLSVTVADVNTCHRDVVEALGFRHIQIPESGSLPFADREFDIVLCNSVIEHVTLPKEACALSVRMPDETWKVEAEKSQSRFAREIRRVGKSYFVQTPHKHFPVEQHVQLPFIQYLPHNATCRLVSITDRFWIKSCQIVDWRLLGSKDMARLFPEAEIAVEHFLALPKSIIAYVPSA